MGGTRLLVIVGLVVATFIVVPYGAWAQRTGGSFGGSSWGSGRSSSGSSWGGSGGRSSWGSGSSTRYGSSSSTRWGGSSTTYSGGYGSSSTTWSGSGGSTGVGGMVCAILAVVLIVGIGVAVGAARRRSSGPVQIPPSAPGFGVGGPMMGSGMPGPMMGGGMPGPTMGGGMPGGMYTPESFSLGALAIAFDSRARAQIQGELDRLAQSLSMGGPGATQMAARSAGEVLSRYLDAAYLTHHAMSAGFNMQTAQQQFQAAVDQERGRYMVETVRADAGGVRKVEGLQSSARAEEGGGFVVVTILVARRGNFQGFRDPTDRASLAWDLQVMLSAGADLQAFEVVWIPSDPNDVMSSAEMAVKFPTLKPLVPDARVGRRACGYCKAVFAAELGSCPHCGAPV